MVEATGASEPYIILLQGFWALVILHLVGDFLPQNDIMQHKTHSHAMCAYHIFAYMGIFLVFRQNIGLSWLQLGLIALQHYCQDRYGWAAKWQRWFKQTPPDKWPQGRLWVDQTVHLLALAVIYEGVPF